MFQKLSPGHNEEDTSDIGGGLGDTLHNTIHVIVTHLHYGHTIGRVVNIAIETL